METKHRFPSWLFPILYFVGRLIVFLSVVFRGSDAFGDLNEYFAMGRLPGWPFFDHWSEYPPAFSFLYELVYRAVGGHIGWFFLLFSVLLAAAGALGLFFFQRIADRIYGPAEGFARTAALFALLAPLPYTWWFYDLLPLCLLLAGIWWCIQDQPVRSGLALGLGILMKWFPGLALAAVLRCRSRRDFLRIAGVALALAVLAFGILWLASPEMTRASLSSQAGRTSWQTVWAYLDGNRTTGWFVYWDWRLDPAQAYVPRGNPPVISPWLTLPIFVAAGLFLFWRARVASDRSLISFIGITFVIFLMWSPGWSPQWVLYLPPLILLTLPIGQGVTLSLALLAITLFEYPLAINQFWYRAVFAMAGLRMLTFALLVFLWQRRTRVPVEAPRRVTASPMPAQQSSGSVRG